MSRTDSLDQRWVPDPATHDHRCDCSECLTQAAEDKYAEYEIASNREGRHFDQA